MESTPTFSSQDLENEKRKKWNDFLYMCLKRIKMEGNMENSFLRLPKYSHFKMANEQDLADLTLNSEEWWKYSRRSIC